METRRLMYSIDLTQDLVRIGPSYLWLTKISVLIIYAKSNVSQANHREMLPFKVSTEPVDYQSPRMVCRVAG